MVALDWNIRGAYLMYIREIRIQIIVIAIIQTTDLLSIYRKSPALKFSKGFDISSSLLCCALLLLELFSKWINYLSVLARMKSEAAVVIADRTGNTKLRASTTTDLFSST